MFVYHEPYDGLHKSPDRLMNERSILILDKYTDVLSAEMGKFAFDEINHNLQITILMFFVDEG